MQRFEIIVELFDDEGPSVDPVIASHIMNDAALAAVDGLGAEGLTAHVHLVDPERGSQMWRLDDAELYEDDVDDLADEVAVS